MSWLSLLRDIDQVCIKEWKITLTVFPCLSLFENSHECKAYWSLPSPSGWETWADETHTGGAGGSDPATGQIEAVEMSPPPPDPHLTGLLVHASSTDTHIHTHTCIHMYTRSYPYHQIANPFFPCLHIQNLCSHTSFLSFFSLQISRLLLPSTFTLDQSSYHHFCTYANLHPCWHPSVTLVYSHSVTHTLVSPATSEYWRR